MHVHLDGSKASAIPHGYVVVPAVDVAESRGDGRHGLSRAGRRGSSSARREARERGELVDPDRQPEEGRDDLGDARAATRPHLWIEEASSRRANRPRPARLSPTLRLCSHEQWVDSDAGYDIAHVINP